MRLFIGVIGLYLVAALALPLGLMLAKSFQGPKEEFVGLANYVRYFSTPALFQSIGNSLWVSILSTLITVPLAFVYAYALTRSRMPFRGFFKTVALVPILVPSLLPGLALVYLFGNQGLLKGALLGHSIYGPIGIVMAEVFTTFPHALLIILAALALADARLYEAAVALRASRPKIFWTVTLPGARYGLISATFVVFTTVVTDFGAPKVIGGQYNVLATDVYKQVIGQQNFQMGAVVSVILLVPAIFAFIVDRAVRRRQVALLSARAVPYQPAPQRLFDLLMLGYCVVTGLAILSIVAISQFAAVVKFFPYNLTLTTAHYDFDQKGGGGWASYYNSIRLAFLTGVIGTVVVFAGAYLVEKARGFALGRGIFHFLAMLPMAVPGLVLGLAYIFFFNAPGESAQRALPHDGDPGHQHDRALLHRGAPDRVDGAASDGSRVRDGIRLAEAAVLSNLLARDRAGVLAVDARHRDLHVRERDDDRLGRRLHLWTEDGAGVHLRAEHGRYG